MLSLSLYCSSQRISVALYQLKELKVFLEVEIKKNKVTGIFELLKKITKTYDLKKLNYIYFSKGPGSYTTMRSVKAIAQALSTINNSEILAVSTFDLFLNKLEKIDSRIIVCFRSEKSKFFFKFFRKKNKSFINDSEIFHDEIEKLEKIVFSKKKNRKLFLITDSQLIKKKLCDNILNSSVVIKVNAKTVADSCFSGFGKKNLSLIYNHSYYE